MDRLQLQAPQISPELIAMSAQPVIQRPSRLREVKQIVTVLYVPNVHGGQPYIYPPGLGSGPEHAVYNANYKIASPSGEDICGFHHRCQFRPAKSITIGMRRPKSKTYIDDPRLDARHLISESVHAERVKQRLHVAVADSVRGGLRLVGCREDSAKSSLGEHHELR